MNDKAWNGIDRRSCEDYCDFAELAKKSVPRVYFLSSLTTMVIIALSFAGWHIASLRSLEVRLESTLGTRQIHVDKSITAARRSYNRDVERFIRAAMENRDLLSKVRDDISEVKERLVEAETKQDLVLEKVGLTN